MDPSSFPDPQRNPMLPLRQKRILVLGLGLSGRAAANLALQEGACVTAVDQATHASLREAGEWLKSRGARVKLGAKSLPAGPLDLVVASPGFSPDHAWMKTLARRGVPVISELELGYEHSFCLNISVTGTNGKTTTTGLIERILSLNQIKTVAAGGHGIPLSSVALQSKDLDFLVLEVGCFQLEHIRFFRPAVAVVLNVTSDHMDRYASMRDYVKVKARLLENQQLFDWTIIQSEVLAHWQSLRVPIRSKIITFSASNRRADLYLDRGLLVSRMQGWTGPLLDMDHCQLKGPHNAENLMAALAVGRVLKIPLESMRAPLQEFTPPPHRCEFVMEIQGVRFVNDSKSTNIDSLRKALMSLAGPPGSEPRIWIVAGGREKGADYHDVGPLLSQHVKGAFLIGEARERLRSAWSLFTPCTPMDSLLKATEEAARVAQAGDIVLLSPACSSLDQFEGYQRRGEVFREAVRELARRASAVHQPERPC